MKNTYDYVELKTFLLLTFNNDTVFWILESAEQKYIDKRMVIDSDMIDSQISLFYGPEDMRIVQSKVVKTRHI